MKGKIVENNTLQDIPAARKVFILNYIKENGSASIKDLSVLQNVSEATVRRDLDAMSAEGILERTRGGAILPQEKSTSFERVYHEKSKLMTLEKKAIGKFAASHIRDGDTVFLDSGTTSLQIGMNLADKKKITVITYDLFIANSIVLNATSTLLVTGGIRKTDFGVLTGPLVLNFIRDIRLNKAFLTADSVDISFGVSNASFDEADIKKELIRSSRYVYLVADHSKFGKVAMTHVCSLHEIDEIVTDSGLSVDMQKELSAENISFTLVSPDLED